MKLLFLVLSAIVVVLCTVLIAWITSIVWMPGQSFSERTLGQSEALADYIRQPSPVEQRIAERLAEHVRVLATEIGPRNVHHSQGLQAAEVYIRTQFEELGYSVERQSVPVPIGNQTTWNIEAISRVDTHPKKIFVIGAHYDTAGKNCPGANDNASGIAAMLVLAEQLKDEPRASSIRYVAFVNEEMPYFQTEFMGSTVYSRKLKRDGVEVLVMISLETMGYFSEDSGSQNYPFPFSLFYPDRGNFIGFVGNWKSRALVRRAIRAFREIARVPSEGVAAPAFVPGISWSDQWAFWQQGYPAFMVTDTAPYRYPDYHLETDTAEKIDYRQLARVVIGLKQVVLKLAIE